MSPSGPSSSLRNPIILPLPTSTLTLPKVSLRSGSTHTVEVKGRDVAHLPKSKDIWVLGERELVLFCVGRQLADDLWGQVAQPTVLDTQLVFPPGRGRARVSLVLLCWSQFPETPLPVCYLPPWAFPYLPGSLRPRVRCRDRAVWKPAQATLWALLLILYIICWLWELIIGYFLK